MANTTVAQWREAFRLPDGWARAGAIGLVAVSLAACQATQGESTPPSGDTHKDVASSGEAPNNAATPIAGKGGNDIVTTTARPGFVTDLETFETFLASRPDAATFRAVYPDVQLVMPDDIVTREFRSDNSRFFARFDAEGRIIGGSFQ